jgi:hypothetical protein
MVKREAMLQRGVRHAAVATLAIDSGLRYRSMDAFR